MTTRRHLVGLFVGALILGPGCSESPPPPPPGQLDLEANFEDFATFKEASLNLRGRSEPKARQTLHEILEKYPGAHRARRMLHNSYLRQRAWDLAVNLYHDVDVVGMTPSERNHLAKLAAQVGQMDFADHLIGSLADGANADAEIVATKALIAFERGAPDDAAALLTPRWDELRALRKSDIHWLMGSTLLHHGDLERAESILRETISIDRKFWPGYYALARTLTEQGRHDEAAQHFDTFEQAAAEQYRQTTVKFWLSGRSLEAQEAINRRAFDEAIPIIESMIERAESDSLRRTFETTLEQIRVAARRQSQGS